MIYIYTYKYVYIYILYFGPKVPYIGSKLRPMFLPWDPEGLILKKWPGFFWI